MRSEMKYANIVWDGFSQGESDLIESIQYEPLKMITGVIKGAHRKGLLNETDLLKLSMQHERNA